MKAAFALATSVRESTSTVSFPSSSDASLPLTAFLTRLSQARAGADPTHFGLLDCSGRPPFPALPKESKVLLGRRYKTVVAKKPKCTSCIEVHRCPGCEKEVPRTKFTQSAWNDRFRRVVRCIEHTRSSKAKVAE